MELTRSIVMVNWMHRSSTSLATVCVKSGVVEQRYVCLVTKCEKQNWLGRLKDIFDCWPKSCGTMLILLPATHYNMHLHLILIWVLLIGQMAYKMVNKYIVAIGISLDKMMLSPCHPMMFIVPNRSNPTRAILTRYFIKTQSSIARPILWISTIQVPLQHYHHLCYSTPCHLYVTTYKQT